MSLLLPLLFFCFLTACGRQSGAWPRIEREGVLRVGLDPTFPPFEEGAGEELRGLDVDLARALAAELGLQAEFVSFGYDGLYDALGTEQVDVLISAMVVVPGRMRDFAYSAPYFNAGEILISPQSATVITADGLGGKRLAVELGAQGHVQAIELAKRLPGLTVLTLPGANEAVEAVASGEAGAALVDNISGRLYLQQHPDLGLVRAPEPITVEPYALVVRTEDETLLEKLDLALAQLTAGGELERIVSRWLGP